MKDEDQDIDEIIEELKKLRANRDEAEAARILAELPVVPYEEGLTTAIFVKRRKPK